MKRLILFYSIIFSLLFCIDTYSINNNTIAFPKLLTSSLPAIEFPLPSYSQEGFGADTLVKTIDGYKPICDFKEDDIVVDGNNHFKRIVNISRIFVKQYMHLVVDDIVICAGCDQQYCVLPDYMWTSAKDIKAGDYVLSHSHEYCKVNSVQLVSQKALLYSFTVEDHVFYIAPYNICVHNSIGLTLGISSIGLSYITMINPIVATIGAATALSVIGHKAYQDYIHHFPSNDLPVVLPDKVLLAERSYYEQRKVSLEGIKQELLFVKNDLLNIKALCGNNGAYHLLQQNNMTAAGNQNVLLKISAAQEMQLSDKQKIDLRTLREVELNALEQDILVLQSTLALHCNVVIEQMQTALTEYKDMTIQTNNARSLWNKNINNITYSTAVTLYEVECIQECLLTHVNQKLDELKSIANYYRNGMHSDCLKNSTNIIDAMQKIESITAEYDDALQKIKAATRYNMAIIEEDFARRGISVAALRNETKNVLELAQKDNARKTLAQLKQELSNIVSCGGPYKDPKDDKDSESEITKHPNGIYKDAPYHHQNSKSGKSQCPDNGQKCLDYSLPSKGNSEQRIAIEGDKFVVLRKTNGNEFHGYTVAWEDLHWSMQNALKEHNLVTKSGKIIRDVAKEIFK